MITRSLKILLWDKEIGRLTWNSRRGISYFEYNSEFLNGSINPFPLIASIDSPSSSRPIMGDKETKLYRKLPPFLADSLPDAWGNQVFECWRKQNKIPNQDITPLDILSFIGKRTMGALEFIPESYGIQYDEKLNLKALSELAQKIFSERENARIMPDESLTMQSLIAVGTSAGGRQPKAIIAINSETGEITSGQIAGQKGFKYYILKFGDSVRSSAELEMAYYEMAKEAGIDMMPSSLIDVEGEKHFITERFDRNDSSKLHMQTLAALFPDADSYEKLLMVCRKMRLPESVSEEIFRRMIFNILANNTDDHNKNFSFLMDQNGKWRLSPAYDLTYIFNIGGYLPETTHCLMMQGKFSGQTKEDAIALAKENGIKKPEKIINEVASAVARFRFFAEKHSVAERWIGAVENRLTELLERWGFSDLPKAMFDIQINGKLLEKVHIAQTYKGNFHLLAEIDGQPRKFVIGKNKEEYALIESVGPANLTIEQLKEMAERYFTM